MEAHHRLVALWEELPADASSNATTLTFALALDRFYQADYTGMQHWAVLALTGPPPGATTDASGGRFVGRSGASLAVRPLRPCGVEQWRRSGRPLTDDDARAVWTRPRTWPAQSSIWGCFPRPHITPNRPVGGERVRAGVKRFRRSIPSPATCGGCRAASRRSRRGLRRRWRRHIFSQILICWRSACRTGPWWPPRWATQGGPQSLTEAGILDSLDTGMTKTLAAFALATALLDSGQPQSAFDVLTSHAGGDELTLLYGPNRAYGQELLTRCLLTLSRQPMPSDRRTGTSATQLGICRWHRPSRIARTPTSCSDPAKPRMPPRWLSTRRQVRRRGSTTRGGAQPPLAGRAYSDAGLSEQAATSSSAPPTGSPNAAPTAARRAAEELRRLGRRRSSTSTAGLVPARGRSAD